MRRRGCARICRSSVMDLVQRDWVQVVKLFRAMPNGGDEVCLLEELQMLRHRLPCHVISAQSAESGWPFSRCSRSSKRLRVGSASALKTLSISNFDVMKLPRRRLSPARRR